MSDKPDNTHEQHLADAYDASLRLKIRKAMDHIDTAVRGHGRCPMCDTNSWVYEISAPLGLAPAGLPVPAYIMKTTKAFFGEAPAIPVIVYTCRNCGFVRQHNLSWINAQIKDKLGSDA